MIALPCDGHTAETIRDLDDEALQSLYWETHAEVVKHPLSTIAQIPQFLIDEDQRRARERLEQARLEYERELPGRLYAEILNLRDQRERLRARVRALGGVA